MSIYGKIGAFAPFLIIPVNLFVSNKLALVLLGAQLMCGAIYLWEFVEERDK